MTAANLHEQIEAALRSSRGRIVNLTSGDQTVWVKRPRRGPGYTVFALHYGAAVLLGVKLFRPPRVSRGASGLAAEARRLAHLHARGWPVPRVLGVTEHWLALSDNGASLGQLTHRLPVPERARVLRSAMEFLQSLHADKGWHGAAQIRNLTQRQDGFGAIDFEDDLEPSMPLELRQARDIFLFLISAARLAKSDPELVPQLLQDALGRASAPVAAEVRSVGAKLMRVDRAIGWLAAHMGRDGPALSAIAKAFHNP